MNSRLLALLSPLRSALAGLRRRRPRRGPGVEPAVRALIEARGHLHRTFAEFGHELADLDGQTRRLLATCDQLLELAAGNSEGINLFQDSLQILDQPIAHVDRSLQKLAPMLEHIERCDHHSAELLKCQLAMGDVLAPLRHMIVFFRIEAAQLEPEHQTTFLTVADEIHRLRELIDQTFDENVARLSAARRTVGAVREKIRRDYAAYSRRITEKRHQIEHAIESLGNQLSQEARRDNQVRDATTALNQEISRLVSALQSEDILNQRLGHVLQALRTEPPAGAEDAWLQLLHRQVDEVLAHFRQARRELADGFDPIVRHANELGEASLLVRSLDNSTASIDGMVQLLLEAFHEITEISADNVKLAHESHAALQPVSDVTENLSSVVIEVSLNIQLIALNAQVRSVQLGDGSGLEVLAARTAEISAELAQLGDRTAAEIVELRSITQGLLAQLDTMRSQGRQHLDDLRTKGTEVVARLHHMRDRTLNLLQEVGSAMENLRHRANAEPRRLDELDTAEACFAQSLDWLRRHTAGRPVTARERHLLDTHLAGYTMAAQRHAHADLTGDDRTRGEHDDRTEFFVDLPAAAPPPDHAAAPSAAPAGPPRTTPAPAAVLADNIELF